MKKIYNATYASGGYRVLACFMLMLGCHLASAQFIPYPERALTGDLAEDFNRDVGKIDKFFKDNSSTDPGGAYNIFYRNNRTPSPSSVPDIRAVNGIMPLIEFVNSAKTERRIVRTYQGFTPEGLLSLIKLGVDLVPFLDGDQSAAEKITGTLEAVGELDDLDNSDGTLPSQVLTEDINSTTELIIERSVNLFNAEQVVENRFRDGSVKTRVLKPAPGSTNQGQTNNVKSNTKNPKAIKLSNGSGETYGFLSFSDDISFTSQVNFNTLDVSTLNYDKLSIDDSGIRLTDFTERFSIPGFDGVDFTKVEVSGLDIDDANKTVNFILKGVKSNSGNGSSLTSNAALLKKVFLQALAIPNDRQFVSLESDTETAEADANFKNTDIARFFFQADVQMKKDFFNFFYNTSLLTDWLNTLNDKNSGLFQSMVNNGKNVIPDIQVRGVIVPETSNGNKTNQELFLSSARYTVNTEITNLSFNTSGLTANESDFVINTWNNDFSSTFLTRLENARNQVIDKINNGGHASYQKLNEILTAIVAAHWYKQASISDKQFTGLINSSDLSSRYTGQSITTSTPFDQAYWNGQSNQALGTVRADVPDRTNVYYDVSVSGGVITEVVHTNDLGNSLTSTQSTVLEDIPQTNYAKIGTTNYANGGSLVSNLPDLVADAVIATPNSSDDKNRFETNNSARILVSIINTGSRAATNAKYELYAQYLGEASPTKIYEATIDNIPAKESFLAGFDYYMFREGTLRFEVRVTPSSTYREVTKANNRVTTEIEVESFVCDKNNSLQSLNFNASSHPVFINAAQLESKDGVEVKDDAMVHYRATERIVLKPGFKARSGGYFKAKISDCNSANSEYRGMFNDFPVTLVSENVTNARSIDESHYNDYTVLSNPNEQRIEEVRHKLLNTQSLGMAQLVAVTDVDESNLDEPQVLNIYPNPAREFIHLSLTFDEEELVTLEILDLRGVSVRKITVDQAYPKGLSHMDISVEGLERGYYLVHLTTQLGIRLQKMLILE